MTERAEEERGQHQRRRGLRGALASVIAGVVPWVVPWMALADLSVGDSAPDFALQGSDGREYTLQGLLEGGERGLVLAWFPKAFTPG